MGARGVAGARHVPADRGLLADGLACLGGGEGVGGRQGGRYEEEDQEEESRAAEEGGLRRVTALIKEKRVPVASSGLLKPGAVVERLMEMLPYERSNGHWMHIHTKCWKHYEVRPETGSSHPERTKGDFCRYDELMEGYGYTEGWVNFLVRKLSDPNEFEAVTGKAAPPKVAV